MKNETVLCIDFGSAYTKVALRKGWSFDANLIRDVPLAPQDPSFCIPSVVAHAKRSGGVKWYLGEEAARLVPSKDVDIFQNWKSDLLSGKATEVGIKFFAGLKDTLRKMRLFPDVNTCLIRLCIPKLDGHGEAHNRTLDVLSKAGWGTADTLFEPETNAVGVFTRGRNVTWYPPNSSERFPNLGQMLDPDQLSHRFHKAVQAGKNPHYGVLVMDIGGFTTDFGYFEFDESVFDDQAERPDIIQHSRPIGIGQMDDRIKERLRPEAQDAIGRMAPTIWENQKRRLYAGEVIAALNPKGGRLNIGEGAEAESIADAIGAFAKVLVREKNNFCRERVKRPIDAVILTGGGALVQLVRHALKREMQAGGSIKLFDLLERPRRVHLWKHGIWGWYDGETEIDRVQAENQELVRGGSAMGGCSLFFEQ